MSLSLKKTLLEIVLHDFDQLCGAGAASCNKTGVNKQRQGLHDLVDQEVPYISEKLS